MQPMPARHTGRAPLYPEWRERYQVVGKIGAGGFADVYEAVDLERDEAVALKVVDERAAATRVLREVEAAQTLDHPNIVALLDFFSDGRRSFLVWELVRGQSLAELVGELADDEAVLAAAQLCDALAYAHAHGVVHRDVKPQNVMIDPHGMVKVMDFGIARLADADTLTAEGEMLGTVAYMSPEQAAGKRVAPPSDVYSAGLLLYELLAGENPVRGATAGETVGNILAGRIAPLSQLRPDLPDELTGAVDAACALRAVERPSAVELSEALREVAGRLGGRRLRPQRLLAPLRRLDVAAERGLGAALAAFAVAALVGALPAYPRGWTLPLALAVAVAWLVAPRLGLALSLGLLAFPLLNVSASIGVVYLGLALVGFFVFRRRPLFFVWPALAVLLAPVYGTLLAPCAAAVFGRRRGPLVAAWSGFMAYLVLALTAAQRSPFAGYAAPGRVALRLRRAEDPVVVATRLWHLLGGWPCLTQALLWAGLAFALASAVRLDRLEARLWTWAGAFSLFYLLERALPVSLWHLAATPRLLLLNTIVAASASGVALALAAAPSREPAVAPSDDPLWDQA
ncbi:MAG TPA: serine/threonine-protein kinase [Thermoleophilia bacterium]|nr:serine/threonine-protein kinase [Thermoleophilia bacterium]